MEYRFNDDLSFTFKIKDELPGRAWQNILANDDYGYIATDAGTGHMWHSNSRENRINRWLNDPLTTVGTERLQWRSGDGTVSLFGANDGYECDVTYGFGYAKWRKTVEDYHFTVTAFVPPDVSARILLIESDRTEGELLYYTDLVLGSGDGSGAHVVTEFDDGVFSARSTLNREFYGDMFRVCSSVKITGFTCDRLSWKEGNTDGAYGAGMLPCIGFAVGNSRQTVIVTGCESEERLKSLCDPDTVRAELLRTEEHWKRLVTPLKIETPDQALDRYINGWALYQVIACRMLARCSVYQCGGAFGFRDQLQDVMAVLPSPRSLRGSRSSAPPVISSRRGMFCTGGTLQKTGRLTRASGHDAPTIFCGCAMPSPNTSPSPGIRGFAGLRRGIYVRRPFRRMKPSGTACRRKARSPSR